MLLYSHHLVASLARRVLLLRLLPYISNDDKETVPCAYVFLLSPLNSWLLGRYIRLRIIVPHFYPPRF